MAYSSERMSKEDLIKSREERLENYRGSFCFLPKPDPENVFRTLRKLIGKNIHLEHWTKNDCCVTSYYGKLVDDMDGFTIEQPHSRKAVRYIELDIMHPDLFHGSSYPTHHVEIIIDNKNPVK